GVVRTTYGVRQSHSPGANAGRQLPKLQYLLFGQGEEPISGGANGGRNGIGFAQYPGWEQSTAFDVINVNLAIGIAGHDMIELRVKYGKARNAQGIGQSDHYVRQAGAHGAL